MFEAFVANKPDATGVIQWMYNSAWPKLWWQFYDYYLMPNGAFYGARKAGTPLHLIYDYGTGSVLAVNNTLKPADGLKAVIRVFDIGLKEKFSREIPLALAADEVRKLDVVLPREGLDKAWFLDLRLYRQGQGASRPSTSTPCRPNPETMDDARALWYLTPVKEFADLTALQDLPAVAIRKSTPSRRTGRARSSRSSSRTRRRTWPSRSSSTSTRATRARSSCPFSGRTITSRSCPARSGRIRGLFSPWRTWAGAEPELKIRGWNIK